MANTRRRRTEYLFHEAVDLPPEARERFLADLTGDDRALREPVRRLLDAMAAMGDFLEPAVADPDASPDDEQPLPARIGRYEIVRVVGRGGMGVVYEARQRNPPRRVALKIIHPSLASRPWLRRFEREAEILGRLSHPGIATIFEAGGTRVRVAGHARTRLPFLAMEYVDGLPLDLYVARRKPDARERLELLSRICDAVQHAHEHGVVHRDLKPSNVLIDERGRPRVIDFGVARATGAEWRKLTAATAGFQVVGTIPYMSPEQLVDDTGGSDARSDVYSLGVILYELLCGRLPIDTRHCSLPDAIRAIREDDPTRPGSLDATLRGDLDAIVGKALRKNPERRYSSAGEMAADIRRHLHDEPIRARPTGTFYQLRKFARRNKVLVGGVTATIVALAIGLVAATFFARGEALARREAERASHHARWTAALGSISSLHPGDAARVLDEVPASLRTWEWRHLRWRAGQHLVEFEATGGLRRAALASDVLFAVGWDSETGGDGVVRLWDLATGMQVGEVRTGARWIFGMAASADGGLLLGDTSARSTNRSHHVEGRRLVLWDVASGRERWSRDGAFSVGSAFDPGGVTVAVGPWDGRAILLLDARTGKERATLPVPDETAFAPDFSPDGAYLVYSGEGNTGIVELATRRTLRSPLQLYPSKTPGRFVDPRGTLLAHDDRGTYLVRPDTGAAVRIPGPGVDGATDEASPASALAEPVDRAPARRVLLTRGMGTVIQRLEDGKVTAVIGHDDTPVAWLRDGTRVATTEGDRVRIWDASTDPRPLRIEAPPRRRLEASAISADGRWLATAGWRFVTLHDLDSGRERWNAYTLEPWTAALAFSPDGRRLAVAGPRGDAQILNDGSWVADPTEPGAVTLLDVQSGRVERALSGPGGNVAGLAFSPDGRALIVTTREGEVRVLDVWSGTTIGSGSSDDEFRRAVPSADGTRIAVGGSLAIERGSSAKTAGVAVRELPDGRVVRLFPAGEGAVQDVAFDATAQRLAAVTSRGEWAVWDVRRGRRLAGSRLAGVKFRSVAFSPGGRRVVSGDGNRTLRFHDPTGHLDAEVLEVDLRVIDSLLFSADGRTLVAAGGDGVVVLETGSPSGGFEIRGRVREARAVVNDLYAELTFADDVMRRLDAGAKLPREVRAEALELVRVRGDHLGWLASDAVFSYLAPSLPEAERRTALRKAGLADTLRPDHPEYVATLAKCRYRAGLHREALEGLARAGELYRAAGREPPLEDHAFAAMAEWALGQRDAARRTMTDLESLVAAAPGDVAPRTRSLVREAQSVLASSPGAASAARRP